MKVEKTSDYRAALRKRTYTTEPKKANRTEYPFCMLVREIASAGNITYLLGRCRSRGSRYYGQISGIPVRIDFRVDAPCILFAGTKSDLEKAVVAVKESLSQKRG